MRVRDLDGNRYLEDVGRGDEGVGSSKAGSCACCPMQMCRWGELGVAQGFSMALGAASQVDRACSQPPRSKGQERKTRPPHLQRKGPWQCQQPQPKLQAPWCVFATSLTPGLHRHLANLAIQNPVGKGILGKAVWSLRWEQRCQADTQPRTVTLGPHFLGR